MNALFLGFEWLWTIGRDPIKKETRSACGGEDPSRSPDASLRLWHSFQRLAIPSI
jgi:hypothetical protein